MKRAFPLPAGLLTALAMLYPVASQAQNLGAAVVWPTNGKAYFFQGKFGTADKYVRWDIATNQMDAGYPVPIASEWRGLWPDDIDAAVVWPTNGKAYFFRDNEYVRYDIKTDMADPGYPLPIQSGWPDLGFSDDIDAVLVWLTNGKAYFFRGNEYSRWDIWRDRADPGYPKPIAGNWPGFLAGWHRCRRGLADQRQSLLL